MKKNILILCISLFWLSSTISLEAKVRLPAIFSSNMVLQQNKDVAIWGWAGASEKVYVRGSWNDNFVETQTDRGGRWKLTLATPKAGGPYTVTVMGSNTIVLDNVLIGEVWIGSGQSNMEWSPSHGTPIDNVEEEIKNGNHPEIRLFHVEKSTSETRQDNLFGTWEVCTSETMKTFSSTAYFFGRELQAKLGVPIGLIHSSWGGTGVEPWIDQAAIETDPVLVKNATKLDPQPWWPMDPGSSFNAMIAPLIPFTIAGAIWYQGESNTVAPEHYAKVFPVLIESWRKDWGYDFPFYYVQIAPFKYGKPNIGVLLREAQTKCLSVPNTGMVVISDIGNINDIHPSNKQDVGLRLANWALNKTYGQTAIAYSGPIYREMKIEGKTVQLHFDYAESGLMAKGGELTHFEIAGTDQKFVKATAKIKGNTIEVSSDAVKKPTAVRFAWDNIAEPNLFNKEGLPASAFRTDSWKMDY